MWNKTITLYNKYEDSASGQVSWYRHLLKNCFVKHTKSSFSAGNTKNSTNSTIIRIPKQSNFISPFDWADVPNNLKGKNMTLQVGDLIVLGNTLDEINEHIQGQRANDIAKKYDALGCMFIASININTDLPGAHYLVRGD